MHRAESEGVLVTMVDSASDQPVFGPNSWSNEGRWWPDDQLGTLNFITAEVRIAAARLVEVGETGSLAQPGIGCGPTCISRSSTIFPGIGRCLWAAILSGVRNLDKTTSPVVDPHVVNLPPGRIAS